MTQEVVTYPFSGGLDTNSAALAVPPGNVISSMNYEPLAEGYGRVQGYERFSGQPAPSAANYWTLPFDNGGLVIAYGDVVTGATSAASAVVIAAPLDFTGSWDDDNAAGTLLVCALSGTFVDNELLTVAATPRATCAGAATEQQAPDNAARKARLVLAQNWHRTQIGKVPGEGPVRGVAVHAGAVFAWRDNVGASAGRCFKATSTGWQAVPALHRLPFSTGIDELIEGASIIGGTSGASALVQRLIITGGDWGPGTAAGHLDLASVSGVFAPGEAIKVGAVTKATAGAIAAVNLAPGGRYRTISHNFYGNAARFRLYGVNGTGPAFEMLEGGACATIATGMLTDTPDRIFEIANHLGLCFAGGSIQFSATGEPRLFSVILGAGEIGFGTEITDVVQANETAVAFFGQSKIAVLQGRDVNDFALDTLTEEAGADPDTAQRIARTVYLDRRGLRSLDATQAFGNFKAGSLSGRFEAYFRTKRAEGAAAVGSFVSRSKSQYRLIWNDGTGLAVYMGGKNPEAMVFGYGDMRPFCFGGGEMADGEGLFVGGEDGYVYRLDSGNSFDGDPIRGFVMTPFNHFGSPVMEERFHKVVIELDGPPEATIGITAQYDYGDGTQPISGASDFTVMGTGSNAFLVSGGGGTWNSAAWNEFYWSSPVEGRAECYIDGIGRNASFIFATNAHQTEAPHVLQAYLVYRSRRKMRR